MGTYSLDVEKRTARRIDPTKIYKQLNKLISRAVGGSRGKAGWRVIGKPSYETQEVPDGYIYKSTLKFKRETQRAVSRESTDKQFEVLKGIVRDAGNTPGWVFSTEPSAKTEIQVKPSLGYADLVVDRASNFDHIYERDSQISIILSALQAAKDSELQNRFHAVLYGPPACGKTEILRSCKKMLGPNAILEFDATSTTKAGAEKALLEGEHIPPVLLIEEIEKTDDNSLRWLLGLLDTRAEIRKTNFNTGNVRREVKLLCLATVNDMVKFKSVMFGALESRFTHKIFCPRPTKAVLEKILIREIIKVGGREEWIKPALDYCVDIEKINDPRRIVAVCLCGKDNLLDGSYQKFLQETAKPEES